MKFRPIILAAVLLMLGAFRALAAEHLTYDPTAFQAALAEGKPILVHVTAPWCPECRAQKPIVAAFAAEPEFKNLTIFDVDFDSQKEALRQLRVQTQSTLVVFKNKTEVGRAVGITRRDAIEALMKKAM